MEVDKSTPVRNNGTNLSKYKLNDGGIKKRFLTPCRRIGLGKSPGSIKKSPKVNCTTLIKDQELLSESESLLINNKPKTSKTECTFKSKRRHEINNITRSCEIQESLDYVDGKNIVDSEKLKTSDRMCNSVLIETESLSPNNLVSEVTDEILTELAIQIKEKQKKIKEHSFQLIPNHLLTLKESIDIWRKAGQQALRYLLKINTERGLSTTLAELIQIHCFDAELLQFVSEEDDFV